MEFREVLCARTIPHPDKEPYAWMELAPWKNRGGMLLK